MTNMTTHEIVEYVKILEKEISRLRKALTDIQSNLGLSQDYPAPITVAYNIAREALAPKRYEVITPRSDGRRYDNG